MKKYFPYIVSLTAGIFTSLLTIMLTPGLSVSFPLIIMIFSAALLHLGFIQGVIFFRSYSRAISYAVLTLYEFLIFVSSIQLLYRNIYGEFINLNTLIFLLEDLDYFINLISYGHELMLAAGISSVLLLMLLLNYLIIFRNNRREGKTYLRIIIGNIPRLIILLAVFTITLASSYGIIPEYFRPAKTFPFAASAFFIYLTGILVPGDNKTKALGLLPMVLVYSLFTSYTVRNKMIQHAGFEVSISYMLFNSLHVKHESTEQAAPDPEIHVKNLEKIQRIKPDYNLLIIVNDSLRHDHFRFSGYHRFTEKKMWPFIKDWYIFNETFSTSNNTSISAPSLFSGAGTEKNRSFLQNNPRLWDYFHESVHTFYISSESLKWKGFDKFIQTGSLDFSWDSVNSGKLKRKRFNDADTYKILVEHLESIRGTFAGVWHNSILHYPYESSKQSKTFLPESIDRRKPEHFINRYDNSLVELSERIYSFLNRINKSGIYDKTIIVFTADHGESLGERGIYYHGKSLYPGEVHVPLLIHIPEKLKRELSHEEINNFRENRYRITSTLDILPTLLYLADRKNYRENSHFTALSQGRSLFKKHDRERVVLSSECFYGYLCLSRDYAFISRDFYYLINRENKSWNRKVYHYSKDRNLKNIINDPALVKKADEMVMKSFKDLHKGFQ